MEKSLLKQIIEALIIASDEPISENRIASLIEEVTPAKVRKVIEALNAEYSKSNRAFFIIDVAGGYQVNTTRELAPWIKKLYKGRIKGRLTQASLESLSIIVFKQPVSRVEIDAIRGVNSGAVVKNLLERNLITITGRADGPGKPLLYGTTKELLQYLGINDINELPKPKEIAEIMGKLDNEQTISENIVAALTDSEALEEPEPVSDNSNGQQAKAPDDGADKPMPPEGDSSPDGKTK